MAWDVEFENDDKEHMLSVTYTRSLASDYENEMKKPTNTTSVKDFLIQEFEESPHTSLSVKQIQGLLVRERGTSPKENSIRNTLSRGRAEGLFTVVSTGEDGVQYWQGSEAAP